MPQRTNEYQHLVKLIHQALAPAGAKVTESAMVTAPGFGQLREIDVLVESEVNPYRMKIAVEAKDHNRKLNVTDIEAIIGKYKSAVSPIVDKVVVVSRRGFAKHAVEKAKAAGIELVRLSEISGSELQKMVPHRIVPTENQKMNFQMGPFLAHLSLTPLPTGVSLKESFTRGHFICRCCGKNHGSPLSYANHYAKKHIMADPRYAAQIEKAFSLHPSVCMKVEIPVPKFLLVIDGRKYPMEALKFHIHSTRASAPMEFKAYEVTGDGVGSKVIQRATAKLPGFSMDLVFPDGLHSNRIVVDFNPDCSKKPPPAA